MSRKSDAYHTMMQTEGWKLLVEDVEAEVDGKRKRVLSGSWNRSDVIETDKRHEARIQAVAMQRVIDKPQREIDKVRQEILNKGGESE